MITIYLSSYRILGLTRWYQNNWNEPRSFCHKKLASWDGYEILILWGRKNIANMFGENIKNICATIRWFSLALVFHTSCACAFYKNETCSLSSYHMHHFRFWYVIDYWKYIYHQIPTPLTSTEAAIDLRPHMPLMSCAFTEALVMWSLTEFNTCKDVSVGLKEKSL